LAEEIKRRDEHEFREEVLAEVNRHPTSTVTGICQSLHVEEEAVRQALATRAQARKGAKKSFLANRLAVLLKPGRHTREPVTIRADDSIDAALRTIERHNAPWLAVIDATTVIGTVGQADLGVSKHRTVSELIQAVAAAPKSLQAP
jgi:CBS domain-containing protein